MRRVRLLLLLVLFAAALGGTVSAFKFIGARWANPSTAVYLGLGTPWDAAMMRAIAEWNDKTIFKFGVFSQYADSCLVNSGKNGAKFSPTLCGADWNTGILAVTFLNKDSNGLMIPRGMVFNGNLNWSVFDGPPVAQVYDFHRVALHELGHLMGLDHEPQCPSCVMFGFYEGYKGSLQSDDISGANILYGGAGIDEMPPQVQVTSHTYGQHVTTRQIALFGTARDSLSQISSSVGSGIASITVNGMTANGGTANGADVALWSAPVSLAAGDNYLTIETRDGSTAQNLNRLETLIVFDNIGGPVNDSFSPTLPAVGGESGSVTGSNLMATRQIGEPEGNGDNSVWWRFAPSGPPYLPGFAVDVTLDTVGSDFDTTLAVYAGRADSGRASTDLAGLKRISLDDDSGGAGPAR